MSDTDLRALAEAATPGPWEVYMTIHAEAWVCEVDRGGFGAVSLPATGRPDYGLANAAFIAAANPTAVLGLLDRIARVEALVEEWQRELDTGAIRDKDARYCWATAANEIRAALADPA